MRKAFVVLILAFVASPAAAGVNADLRKEMTGYVGQPLARVMAKHGPPTNAFDAGNGQRAFQWDKSFQTTKGGGGVMVGTTFVRGKQKLKTRTCFMTLYATGSEASWTVASFEPPKC